MGHYKFIKTKDVENRFDNTNVSIESESISLPELLEDFADFLRGCGFQIDGHLDVIEDEE